MPDEMKMFTITLTQEQYDTLVLALGYATVAAFRDSKVLSKSIHALYCEIFNQTYPSVPGEE